MRQKPPAERLSDGRILMSLKSYVPASLVLMDVVLPGIDGLAASRSIKDDDPGVTVLLLSTYDMAGFHAQVEASGAAAFLPKSAFGPDVLLALLGSPSGG